MAAAAGRGRRGDAAGAQRQSAQPAGLPLALPVQTRHQPQDHPHVSHMRISSFCCCRGATVENYAFIPQKTAQTFNQSYYQLFL